MGPLCLERAPTDRLLQSGVHQQLNAS